MPLGGRHLAAPGLCVGSLAASVLSAFKNELFEFAPRLLGGALLLPQTSPPTASLQLLLPISFINTGYAEGVIEWVALKLVPSDGGDSFVYEPSLEIDLMKFTQGRRGLHADSTIGAFHPFPLESKKSVNEPILCLPRAAPDGKVTQLPTGTYRMDICLEASNASALQLMLSIDEAITPKLLGDFAAGGSIFVTNRAMRL